MDPKVKLKKAFLDDQRRNAPANVLVRFLFVSICIYIFTGGNLWDNFFHQTYVLVALKSLAKSHMWV